MPGSAYLIQQRAPAWLNVMDFGATGNGTTDDTAAINAAIAALPANGGTVYLPAGTYLVSSTINLTAFQRLLGAGVNATQIVSSAATFPLIHAGNRQVDGVMRNDMCIEKMTVSHAGGASTNPVIWIDGGGQGTHCMDVVVNQGAYGFQLTDLDRCEFWNCRASNQRNDGFRLETGKENTWGTVAFYNCSTARSDNNSIGWHFTTNADQASPNPFDRVSIYNTLFFMTTGITGGAGLQIDNPGCTSLAFYNCLFEQNLQQVVLNKYTNVEFFSCTFLDANNAATDIIYMTTDNHDVSVYSCVFQQATNVFHIASGFPSIAAYGRSKNNGNISNIVNGSTSLKTGTDTNFMGANNIDLGSTANPFLHIFTNQLDMGLQNDTALSNSSTIATFQKGVLPCTATGNVTGIILATGNDNPSSVLVVNKSAFTITFAAQATSNVSGGAAVVIPAGQMMWFTWLSSTNLWYPQT